MSKTIDRVRRALMATDVRATGVTLDKEDVKDLLALARRAPPEKCGARGHTGSCVRPKGHHLSTSKHEQFHETRPGCDGGGVLEQWWEGA